MTGFFGLITCFCIGYILQINKKIKLLEELIDILFNNSFIDKDIWKE